MRKLKKIIKYLPVRLYALFKGLRIVHYIHIGKTGGTAVKHALKEYCYFGNSILILHKHSFTLEDVWRNEKVIFAVRDPLTRFVSGFYSRKRQGLPRYFSEWTEGERTAFKIFDTPNDLASALTSQNAELKMSAVQAMNSIYHVKSSYWDWFVSEEYLKGKSENLLFVCRQEKLNTDFMSLIDLLGLPKNIELSKNPVESHKNPDKSDKKLDEQSIVNLKNWYSDDYKFLKIIEEMNLAYQK